MYKEPQCIKKCNRIESDGVKTCTSCGKIFKPLFTEDEIKKALSKTEDEKMKEFIDNQPDLIKKGIETGILSEKKINEYKKN